MSNKKPVVVYGASGYTGRLICEYLREYNIPFIAAGRDAKRVQEVMDKVPGIYGSLGSRDRAKGYVYSNHHEKYTVDESTLKRGAAVYAQFAIDFLEANA